MLLEDMNRKPLARLLIVEDEALVALQLQRTLVNAGYQVLDSVASGEDAIDKAIQLHPDLVLMDILLAGKMDGVQAAAQIRAQLDIPIVYLSAHAEDERVRQSIFTEPYSYLAKPVSIQELRATLEMALYKHQLYLQLSASEARWRTLVDNAPEAIIVTDDQLNVLSWNKVAEHLYGWKAEEVLGQPLNPLIGTIYAHETDAQAAQIYLEHGFWHGEVQHRRKNGDQITVMSSVAPIKDDQGKALGLMEINRDITEWNKSNQAYQPLNLQGVSESIRTKRAVREFQDVPIPEDLVKAILNAGRRAQSSKNSQPWHFVAIREKTVLKALAACGQWAGHLEGAALGVALLSEDPANRFQILFDLGQSAAYMQLAAWEQGIASCMATIYNSDQARQVLGFPEELHIRFAISFGYPLIENPPPLPVKKGGRRSFDEVVHWEHW
jgi:PAS domain S-box-containing protein